MARFELNLYDMETEKIVKTLQKNIIPVDLYIKFQEFNDSINSGKIKTDAELFTSLQDLFVETFADLTKAEYMKQTFPGEVLKTFKEICEKSLIVKDDNLKN